MHTDCNFEIQGEIPGLKGIECQSLVIQEYWHEGIICDKMNVAWLSTDAGWHRIYFDSGIVFFRGPEDIGPSPTIISEWKAEYKLHPVTDLNESIILDLVIERDASDLYSMIKLQTDRGILVLNGHDTDENSWHVTPPYPDPQQDDAAGTAQRTD